MLTKGGITMSKLLKVLQGKTKLKTVAGARRVERRPPKVIRGRRSLRRRTLWIHISYGILLRKIRIPLKRREVLAGSMSVFNNVPVKTRNDFANTPHGSRPTAIISLMESRHIFI